MTRVILLIAFLLVTRCGMRPVFAADDPVIQSEVKGPSDLLRVWKGTDGSLWVFVKGEPKRISLPRPKVDWREYTAYGSATFADWLSTRWALKTNGEEKFFLYQCSPHRPGCLNMIGFSAFAFGPPISWLAYDLRYSRKVDWDRSRDRRTHTFVAFSKKGWIVFRLSAAIWNTTQIR